MKRCPQTELRVSKAAPNIPIGKPMGKKGVKNPIGTDKMTMINPAIAKV